MRFCTGAPHNDGPARATRQGHRCGRGRLGIRFGGLFGPALAGPGLGHLGDSLAVCETWCGLSSRIAAVRMSMAWDPEVGTHEERRGLRRLWTRKEADFWLVNGLASLKV